MSTFILGPCRTRGTHPSLSNSFFSSSKEDITCEEAEVAEAEEEACTNAEFTDGMDDVASDDDASSGFGASTPRAQAPT